MNNAEVMIGQLPHALATIARELARPQESAMADQGTEGLLSPLLRDRRLAAARPHLRGRVLDFGCGSGALAGMVGAESYTGVDRDSDSLRLARIAHPAHHFVEELSPGENAFDTVVALAVIEHIADPVGFLSMLREFLKTTVASSIVITTPHPIGESVHELGARVGLFSSSANEEHETLLDRAMLTEAGLAAGLTMSTYRRFLLGFNQLAVFRVR